MIFSEIFKNFLDNIRKFGIEFFGRYYGVYRAEVVDNNDPDGRGRIWVKCPAVYGHENTIENAVYPIMPMGGSNKGVFFPPEIGDSIVLCFENGDINEPNYLGGWWTKTSGTMTPITEATNNPPNVRGIKTRYGHKILFYDDTAPSGPKSSRRGTDTETNPRIEIETNDGQKITLSDESGSEAITIEGGDSYITINKDGKVIVKAKDGQGVYIGGETLAEALVKGVALKEYFDSLVTAITSPNWVLAPCDGGASLFASLAAWKLEHALDNYLSDDNKVV